MKRLGGSPLTPAVARGLRELVVFLPGLLFRARAERRIALGGAVVTSR